MDQKKIGSFLRELRKERRITQEQFAEKLVKSIRNISIIGLAALIVYMVLRETDAYDMNTLFRYVYGWSEALINVTVVMFPLYTTGLLSRLRIRKTGRSRIPGPVLKVIAFIAAFAVAALIRIVLSKMFG